MPNQSTPNSSTPASGTGQGAGLRGAAGAIAGMLSDDFTITDNGQADDGRREPQHQQTQRREPREGHREPTQHDDNEPVIREDVEEIDDEGNVRYRQPEDGDPEGDEEHGDPEGDDPDGKQEPKTGELKDDTEVTIPAGDGKTEKVTFGELKNGYLRQADYTRKTQALATERETITKDRTDIGAERASLTASIEAVSRFVKELIPPEPTAAQWEELRVSNPAGYAAAREEWRSFKERLQGVAAAHQQANQGQQAEVQRVIRDTAAKEKEKLEGALPEWKDARVKKRDIADMFETARELGFTDDDVRNTVDHRLMLLLIHAAKYKRLVAAKKNLTTTNRGRGEPAEGATKIRSMGAGGKGQMPTRKTAVVNARDNHHKSQNVRSGAALIEKLLD